MLSGNEAEVSNRVNRVSKKFVTCAGEVVALDVQIIRYVLLA